MLHLAMVFNREFDDVALVHDQRRAGNGAVDGEARVDHAIADRHVALGHDECEFLVDRGARGDIAGLGNNLEQIGDIIENIVEDVASKMIAPRRAFSEAGMAELCEMHARLISNLRMGLNVFLNGDLKSAELLLAQKVEFREMGLAFADSHLHRLAGQSLQTIETSALHLDIINDFKRINSHICSIAYPILEQAGALSRTRLRESVPRETAAAPVSTPTATDHN